MKKRKSPASKDIHAAINAAFEKKDAAMQAISEAVGAMVDAAHLMKAIRDSDGLRHDHEGWRLWLESNLPTGIREMYQYRDVQQCWRDVASDWLKLAYMHEHCAEHAMARPDIKNKILRLSGIAPRGDRRTKAEMQQREAQAEKYRRK